MNYRLLISLTAGLLAACAHKAPPPEPVKVEPPPVVAVNGRVPADTSHLKIGKWSYEANKLAVAAGCFGQGAWLITPEGPREAYRVFCDNGQNYTAVCDSMHCVEDH
jgi:hypothetical protein